jgi:hypothetical protein
MRMALYSGVDSELGVCNVEDEMRAQMSLLRSSATRSLCARHLRLVVRRVWVLLGKDV